MKKAFFEIETSISHYSDARTLLIENAPDALKDWTPDELFSLNHIDDFELCSYFVIDGKTVITTDASGDIWGVDSLEKFMAGIREECSDSWALEF